MIGVEMSEQIDHVCRQVLLLTSNVITNISANLTSELLPIFIYAGVIPQLNTLTAQYPDRIDLCHAVLGCVGRWAQL